MKPSRLMHMLLLSVIMLMAGDTVAQRQMENLDRGVVAVRNANGNVFVSWRLSGTEPDDIAFNVYRSSGNEQPVRLNNRPVTTTTGFSDETADTTSTYSYSVKPVLQGKEGPAGKPFTLKPGNLPYFSIHL